MPVRVHALPPCPSPSHTHALASVCTSRALHERDDLLDHRLSNKKEFPKGNNNTKAIKNPRKPKKNKIKIPKANNNNNNEKRRTQSADFFLFVGFVDFPFRAINLHCANVVIVVFAVVLVLFFIIKIYNIYCHKPDGDYNIWSSTPQPARPKPHDVHKKCECAAQRRREKTGEALGVEVSVAVDCKKLAVSLFTHKTVIKFKVFGSLSISFG